MNLEQIMLVQTSFVLVMPIADTAAALFFQRLFELDPSLRPVFGEDMPQQRQRLISILKLVVNGLARLDLLVPAARELGLRYARYGVCDQHYDTVMGALLWMLRQVLGQAFTPEIEQAWGAAYTLLTDTIKPAEELALAA